MDMPTPTSAAYKEYLEVNQMDSTLKSSVTQVARYALLKFGISVVSSPFETVRLLRQVQVASNDNNEEEEEVPFTADEWDVEQTTNNQSMANESRRQQIGEMYANNGTINTRMPSDISKDSSGYLKNIKNSSGHTMTTNWPVKLNKKDSLLKSVGSVARREGLFSLWQGVFASWTHEVLMDLGRATVEEALDSSPLLINNGRINMSSEDIFRPSLIAGLAQGIVGFILTPLEMAKIRLMAQSVWLPERKYTNIFQTLKVMIREETGLTGLFRNPILTFVSYFLKPVLRIVPVSLVDQYFDNNTGDESSIIWTASWLLMSNLAMCLPLLVTMPIETIRRRLILQTNTNSISTTNSYVTRVQIQQRPYTGVFNCAWRMAREEGINSFYQGWGVQIAASTASFATTMLAELGEVDLLEEGDDSF